MRIVLKPETSKKVCKCIRFTRIVCDHATFAGASVDVYCAFQRINFLPAVYVSHVAFLTAALSVYLMHLEERFEHNGVGYGPLIQ